MKQTKTYRTIAVALVCLATLAGYSWPRSGQTVRIAQDTRGHVLSAENSSLTPGSRVMTWSETNVPAQRWLVETVGEDGAILRNAYTGLCLAVDSAVVSGGRLIQTTASEASRRGVWVAEPVAGTPHTYIIRPKADPGLCLSAAPGGRDGIQLTLAVAGKSAPQRIRWCVTTDSSMPSELTPAVRDEMMTCWKRQYYRPAQVGHIIGKGGWWEDAEMMEIVVDALETTGDTCYATMFDQLFRNFCHRNGTDWRKNDYNDDIAWMCIACTRAYLLTGRKEYLRPAKANFDMMYARADKHGDHTLIWCMGKPTTNSCINGPAAVAACYLAQATGNKAYYDKARATYMGQRAILYNMAGGHFNGQVFDCYDPHTRKIANHWSSTYNQGTSLGAACMLYAHFGDPVFRQDADALMEWTASHLTDGHGIINVCQTVKGDLTGFKGILMRYVRQYAVLTSQPRWLQWMAANAFHAYNNRNERGVSMSAWMTKTPDGFCFSNGGDFRHDGVGAMTCISAAFNAMPEP